MCFSCVALGLRTFLFLGVNMSKAFGNHLRQLRIKKGYTQEQVAKALGINRTTYTKYETGVTQPSLEQLKKLCSLFEIDYNTLLNY